MLSEMNPINNNVFPHTNWKGIRSSDFSKECFEKGLEGLSVSMRKLYASLEVAPKVLFVKLHKFEIKFSSARSYKLRKKSKIKFLTQREVNRVAKQDVQLMYNLIKRKILTIGKLMTHGIKRDSTLNDATHISISCKVCRQIFYKKREFLNHMLNSHPEISNYDCSTCGKKFLVSSALENHKKVCHQTKIREQPGDCHEFDQNSNMNPLPELSRPDQNKPLETFLQKMPNEFTTTNQKEKNSEDFSCEIMCCECLKKICEITPLCHEGLDGKFCQECPYCGLKVSVSYFEHHIATMHLICNEEECHSQYVKTGYRLRKVLAIQDNIKCIHADCDHYFFIDSSESTFNFSNEELEDQLSDSGIQNYQNRAKTKSSEKFVNGLGDLEDFQKEREEFSMLSNKYNYFNVNFASEAKHKRNFKETHFEDHVMSSNSDFSDSDELDLCCSVCEETFNGEQKLLKHLFNQHRLTHPFTCDVCYLCYKDGKDLRTHAYQVHRKVLVLENVNSQNDNHMDKISSATPCTAEDSDVPSNKCDSTESPTNSSEEAAPEIQKVSSTESKVKIPCIVEKVDYPLDIHSLYANIRKVDSPMEVDSSELRLPTSFSTNDNKTPVDTDTPSTKEPCDEKKLLKSLSIPLKVINMNEHKVETESNTSETNFKCKVCDRIFDSKKTYSEHMFFMHDVVYDDSIIEGILKPNPNEDITSTADSKNEKCETGKLGSFNLAEASENSALTENVKPENPIPISVIKVETVNTKESQKLDRSYSCHICSKSFLTNTVLEKHKLLVHSNSMKSKTKLVNVENQKDPNKKENDGLTCLVCKSIFKTPIRLQAHLMVNHSKVTDICLLCNRLFAFGRGVRHIIDFHVAPIDHEKTKNELSWDGDVKNDVKEAVNLLGRKNLLAICGYTNYFCLNDATSFKCKHCRSTYSAVRFYRNHYIQKHDKHCALCNRVCISSAEFLNHLGHSHHSTKHYLWFIEIFISTILKTERKSDDFSESLTDIIERKISENEAEIKSQLLESVQEENDKIDILDSSYINQINEEPYSLPQTTCVLPKSTVTISLPVSELPFKSCGETSQVSTEITKLPVVPYKSDVLELPDFCMEYEITENETIIMQDYDLNSEAPAANLCNNETCTNEDNQCKLENKPTALVTDAPNSTFDYSANIPESS